MKTLQLGIVLIILFLAACTENAKKSEIIQQGTFKHATNRAAAEWEPAKGVIVVWPLDLPHQLIIELAKDVKLYTMVPNQAEIDSAKVWFTKWNIDLNNVEFVVSAQGLDSWWARDWGAFAVFDSLGTMRLADGQYQYSTPVTGIGCNDSLEFLFSELDPITGKCNIVLTTDDDNTPLDIAKYMGYERTNLPFAYTGGNVFMDGHGTSLSTCIIKNENNFIGVDEAKFVEDVKQYLGISQYNFISNFEHSGIQHIDCYLKMLENNRLLVMQPPADHELYPIYEHIANAELPALRNASGEAYEIIRLNTARYSGERLAAYSNSLILNKNVYVPLFGIAQDSIALTQWQNAMPGYTVKGFLYKVHEEAALHPRVRVRRADGFGWKDGDALHCRTRAMWDPQMLYVSMAHQPRFDNGALSFEATIFDYANAGLIRNKLQLNYRLQGSENWNIAQLDESETVGIFNTKIEVKMGDIVEYFISATNADNKTETSPMTAPLGFFSYTIK